MRFRTWAIGGCVVTMALWCYSPVARAADDAARGPDPQLYQRTVDRAIDFLRTSQTDEGAFTPSAGPAVTSLVAAALLRQGRSPDDPLVKRSLDYILRFVQEDGGIYAEGSRHRNYETAIAMMALSEANRDGRYRRVLERAEKFLKGLQWDEDEGNDPSHVNYGGAGYGGHNRPDLSNTSFLIDALKSIGRGPDDPAIRKALIFVSRCQNLETEHNTTPFAAKNPDGGFYYTPAAGGTSQAGKTPEGGLRSYGSMTYAGLKSMIYAGVGPDDPRVRAAVEWIRQHYGLDTNPGMGDAGLYYYYHTFAKALDALGLDTVEDENGQPHDWRRELAEELARRQQPDGSWVNRNRRWMEGDPNLVTAYALLALSYARPQAASPSSGR